MSSSVIDMVKGMFSTSTFPYKKVMIFFTLCDFAFETYIALRQYKVLQNKDKKLPHVLKGKIDEQKFKDSDNYGIAKAKFNFVSNTYDLFLTLYNLAANIQPKIWNYSILISSIVYSSIFQKSSSTFPQFSLLTQNILFFNFSVIFTNLLSLPVSYVQHFVLEEKFGFNKTTLKTWIMDTIKSNALIVLLGSPILYLLGWLLDKFSDNRNFVLYIWLFCLALQITMFLLSSTVIEPLFNKFTPLEEGELKTKIEDLAKECGFPLSDIFVIDGSKRSSHSNAYFSGLPFLKKRIVLFDTLIKDSSVDEVVAVLAHEIGHWKMNHTTKMLAISQIHFALFFKLFASTYKNFYLFKDLGFVVDPTQSQISHTGDVAVVQNFPFFVGLMLFGYLMKPTDSIHNFLFNLYSRHNEYEADEFAVKLGKGETLCDSLISLHVSNLSTVSVDPLFSKYHYTHPTLPERLGALENKITEQKKKN